MNARFLAFDFLLPFLVNNHCYFVLFVLVFFSWFLCVCKILGALKIAVIRKNSPSKWY